MKKFSLRCKLAAIVCVMGTYCMIIGCVIVLGFVVFIAYSYSNANYSLALTILWYLQLIFNLYYIPPLFFNIVIIVYILTIYLNLRFKQVLDLINIYNRNSEYSSGKSLGYKKNILSNYFKIIKFFILYKKFLFH